jgi:DNA-binding transcriptional LysR family regulator
VSNLNFRSVDLNLLPVLRELLRTRNVTRAAENLNMSQSAVSEALRRLRFQFDDQVLVRVGREMAPTHFAQSLLAPVEAALEDLEQLLAPQRFDPRELHREFVIATADIVVLALGSGLVDRLERQAPRVTVQFVDLYQAADRDLKAGRLDFVIRPRTPPHDDPSRSVLVLEEDWVYIARKGHPAISPGVTAADLEALTSVAFRPDPESPLRTLPHASLVDQMRTPQFLTIPFIVERSDAIALIQRHLAERLEKMLDIQLLDVPTPMERKRVMATWEDIHENDPAHRWFRRLLAEVSAATAASAATAEGLLSQPLPKRAAPRR